VTYLASDDGFRLLDGVIVDTARGAPCTPQGLSSKVACIPNEASGQGVTYSDAACTSANPSGAVQYPSACTKPATAVVTETDPADKCKTNARVFQVGAPSSAPFYFAPGNGSCIAMGQPPDFDVAPLGPALADSQFPDVSFVVHGTGKARIRVPETDAPLSPYGTWLAADGGFCFPYGFSDGKVRCGPPTIAFVGAPSSPARLFADAACSTVVVAVPPNCNTGMPYAVEATKVSGCAALEPHLFGPSHAGPIFHEVNGMCVPASADPTYAYYEVGAVAPVTDFAEVVDATL
jgi:hypothetical protein